MPKASTDTTDAPKRAPRKRAVRRVVSSDDAPVRRRTRATTPRVVEDEPVATRKAPVYLNETTSKSSKNKFVLAFVFFVVVVGVASWIGFSDAGQIDVTARINTSNQEVSDAASAEAGSESVTVPVQNTPPAAISGIRPRTDGGGRPDPVPPPVEEETASTTEEGTEEESTTEPTTESEEASTTETSEETPTEEVVPE